MCNLCECISVLCLPVCLCLSLCTNQTMRERARVRKGQSGLAQQPTSGCGKCSSAFLSLQRNSALQQNGRKLPQPYDRQAQNNTHSQPYHIIVGLCPSKSALDWHWQPSVECSIFVARIEGKQNKTCRNKWMEGFCINFLVQLFDANVFTIRKNGVCRYLSQTRSVLLCGTFYGQWQFKVLHTCIIAKLSIMRN